MFQPWRSKRRRDPQGGSVNVGTSAAAGSEIPDAAEFLGDWAQELNLALLGLPAPLADAMRAALQDGAAGELQEQRADPDPRKDVQERLRLLRAAVARAPDRQTRAGILTDLGTTLYVWYELTGREADLGAALAVYDHLVGEFGDVIDVPLVAFNHGNALHERAVRFDRDALDAALDAYERAVRLTPDGADVRPARLSGLATGLRERFHRTGRREFIDRCIELHAEALETTSPSNVNDVARHRSNLGTALRIRALSFDRDDDLARAIQLQRLAVEEGPSLGSRRRGRLHALGNSLFSRYLRSGSIDDLEDAIGYLEEARSTVGEQDPQYPGLLSDLGEMLEARAARAARGSAEANRDRDRAIECLQSGFEHEPSGSLRRAQVQSSLGSALFRRAMERRDNQDGRSAVSHLKEALDSIDPESPMRPNLLRALGQFCHVDYLQISGDRGMLEAALVYFAHAVAATPPDALERSATCFSLANVLRDVYRLQPEAAIWSEGLKYYREAAERGAINNPDIALLASYMWSDWLADRKLWSDAADALSPGIETMRRLVAAQLSRKAKEAWLRAAAPLPAQAAYALAEAGDPARAVVSLENGRALLLAEMLQLTQIDLAGLERTDRPELAERFRVAAAQWRDLQVKVMNARREGQFGDLSDAAGTETLPPGAEATPPWEPGGVTPDYTISKAAI
jgi:tetratricopeptide (TPR) repeat protein